MVFISLDELLPTAEEYGEHHGGNLRFDSWYGCDGIEFSADGLSLIVCNAKSSPIH